MPIPRVYTDEACPLEGYEEIRVRVLANASDAEWREWCAGNLGAPNCEECAKLNAPAPDSAPAYCPACTQARSAYGRSLVAFYGPILLGEDVSTPDAALALFDRDDALPSEIVIWLQLLPGAVRERRTEALLGNLISSATTPTK